MINLMVGLTATIAVATNPMYTDYVPSWEKGPGVEIIKEEEEPTSEELWYDDLSLLAQLVEAEAGNQDLKGKRLVVDVILNRVDNPNFPNSIPEVIYQKKQFSCLYDGNFERAGWHISEESFEAVRMEAIEGNRIDSGILYFSTKPVNGKNHWKYQDHWFSY